MGRSHQPESAAVWARLAERNADTEIPPSPEAKALAQSVLADLAARPPADQGTKNDRATKSPAGKKP